MRSSATTHRDDNNYRHLTGKDSAMHLLLIATIIQSIVALAWLATITLDIISRYRSDAKPI